MRKSFIKRRALILFTLLLFGFSTTIMAQKVNLNYSKQSLRTVLKSISQQTGYSLAYSKEVVNLDESVSINVNNAELSEVMTKLLSPYQLAYEIKENKIFIVANSELAANKAASSQQSSVNVQIQGVVTDEKGSPIIGANISVPNTSIGTITNFDGRYNLSVPKGAVVKFSYIGYTDQNKTITNQSVVNVQLSEDVETLNELIVVGYGVQKKSVVTAAISRVTADELNNSKPSRVEDALKGKVSGGSNYAKFGSTGIGFKIPYSWYRYSKQQRTFVYCRWNAGRRRYQLSEPCRHSISRNFERCCISSHLWSTCCQRCSTCNHQKWRFGQNHNQL